MKATKINKEKTKNGNNLLSEKDIHECVSASEKNILSRGVQQVICRTCKKSTPADVWPLSGFDQSNGNKRGLKCALEEIYHRNQWRQALGGPRLSRTQIDAATRYALQLK